MPCNLILLLECSWAAEDASDAASPWQWLCLHLEGHLYPKAVEKSLKTWPACNLRARSLKWGELCILWRQNSHKGRLKSLPRCKQGHNSLEGSRAGVLRTLPTLQQVPLFKAVKKHGQSFQGGSEKGRNGRVLFLTTHLQSKWVSCLRSGGHKVARDGFQVDHRTREWLGLERKIQDPAWRSAGSSSLIQRLDEIWSHLV